ncbi:MAG: hypothetical protein ABI688_04475, partial [Bacteroidota bacterium]
LNTSKDFRGFQWHMMKTGGDPGLPGPGKTIWENQRPGSGRVEMGSGVWLVVSGNTQNHVEICDSGI